MNLRLLTITALLSGAILTACGGGSASTPPPPPPPPPPAADTTPPTTTIDFQPPIITTAPIALFMFSSSETGATYEASLDGGPFVSANTVPYELTGLAEGLHFIAVRARDSSGNVDATPATAQWLIQAPISDTAPPTTTIDYQPSPISADGSAVFIFSASETSTYECSVDAAAFSSCPQFFTLTALADGIHNLAVRATDAAGNTDPTPTTAQWIVSLPTPETFIFTAPDYISRATAALFVFSPVDATGTFEVSVDGAAFTTTASPLMLSGLTQGTHNLSVRSRNAEGRADPTPAFYSWSVDRVPPSARIAFPTGVGYTGANTIAVRGYANDAHGVVDVTVNGIPATSLDNFESWRADVPLVTGANTISVTVTDVAGNIASGAATATIVNKGEPVYYPRGIDYDSNGDRLIVGDRSLNVIYSVTLDEGITSVVSPAPANPLFRLSDLVVDSLRHRALVVDSLLDTLVAVDLDDGTRTVVAPASAATATTHFSDSSVIAVDELGNRAFVTNAGTASVMAIDLDTGVRTVVTSDTVGIGSVLTGAAGIAYDNITTPGTPRLLVSEGSDGTATPGHIVAVDIANGDRAVFSSFSESIGTGALIDTPGALKMSVATQHLLVLDAAAGQVVSVNLVDGDRSLFSAGTVRPSIAATRGMAFVPATSRVLVASGGGTIISIDNLSQRSTLLSTSVGSGVAMNYPEGIVVEQASGTAASLLVTDAANASLTRVNLATGARTLVSSSAESVGTGPSLTGIVSVVRDTRSQSGGNSVLALVGDPGYSLVSINLANGNRHWITDLNFTSVGVNGVPAVSYPRNLRLDAANNRVYFTDTTGGGNDPTLYVIDLQNLTRSAVTSGTRGAGPLLERASAFVLAPADQPTRALVEDEGPGGILSVDLATGDRSVFLAAWAEDPQPGASVTSAMYFDAEFSRLIGTRAGSASNLFSIAMDTGTQRVISGQDPVAGTVVGHGPTPYGAMALDVDADGVAYVGNAWIGAIFAIDLESGDRVIVAR